MTEEIDSFNNLEHKMINEEYKIWRKNVPYLYDMLLTHALNWPSLSVQWFPDAVRNDTNNTTTQRLLLSTHTSNSDTEFIKIVSVTFPDEICESFLQNYGETGDGFLCYNKIKVVQQIPVVYEVNRTRYCPFATNIIAIRSDHPEIHIYDYTKYLSESIGGIGSSTCSSPTMELKGHTGGGYGLSWNKIRNGELLSTGEDKMVCLFDINEEGKEVISKLEKHTSVVNDCSFNYFNGHVGCSVGDDRRVVVWDTRMHTCSMVVEKAHSSDIFCCDFSCSDENLVATGCKDGSVKVWDIRNGKDSLHTLLSHKKEVLQVQWSPHFGNVLASSGSDRRVCMWDLSLGGSVGGGDMIDQMDRMDGPGELLFMHGGHTNSVCDFCFNPLEPWEIASVAEDNILQIWQKGQSVGLKEG